MIVLKNRLTDKYLFIGIVLTVLVLFCHTTIFAQPKELKFSYLTPDEGISQPTIYCIIQDETGFIWFGTRDGLNRYNGYEVENFYSVPKDNRTIAGNVIHDLNLAKNGIVWIGTNGGLCKYEKDYGFFTRYNLNVKGQSAIADYGVSALFEDHLNSLWVGVYLNGLYQFDPTTGIFTSCPATKVDSTPRIIRVIIEDKSNRIWLGTDNGLILYHRDTKESRLFVHNENVPGSLPDNSIQDMVLDREGSLWLGTLSKGLCKINIDSKGEFYFTSFFPETKDQNRIKILTLCKDKSQGIWIGTENGGLDYFSFLNYKFKNYRFNKNSDHSLNNNSIQSIFVDRAENIWVGTYTGGVNFVKSNQKKIDTYQNTPCNENSLSYGAVNCFYETTQGDIWFGTDGGGVSILNRQTGNFTHFNTSNSSLRSDAIIDIHGDRKGNIWVSGWDCGLNLFDPKTKDFIRVTKDLPGVSNQNIKAVLFDSKDRCWISFAGIGLGLFDSKRNTFTTYTSKNSGFSGDFIFDIKEAVDGKILIGHLGGLTLFDAEKENFETFYGKVNSTDNLSHSQVNVILPDNDSAIWVGTDNGLNLFNPKTRKFTQLFKENGLPNNRIKGLVKDKHENIWISSENGITQYNKKTHTFRNYSITDGLLGKSFTRRSAYRTKGGELLFGGTKGISLFYPDSLKDNPHPPEVVITGFKIFNENITITQPNSPLLKQINETERIYLQYYHSVISFEFAALDYTSPSQNEYAFILEGFDKGWNYVGNRRTATYTNLDPGEYIFRVKAANNDKVWNTTGKTIIISISPPFWKTYWFFGFLVLFLAASIFLFIRFRIYRYKMEQIQLEKKVHERTFELEEATILMEEKQEEISLQREELLYQRDNLEEANQILTHQQEQILKQNSELDKHRNQLETLVEERTHELEKALFKAEESDRLKSSFLANMSHEIRTPMNAIIGFSSLLRDDGLSMEDKENFINIITTNGESLLVLINDILDLSKLQADQMMLNIDTFDLLQLLIQINKSFQIEAGKKEITLQLSLSNFPEFLKVESDTIRVKQVISNLLTNAIKFTPKGVIEFGILPCQQNLVTVYVKDTGIGIPEGIGDTIFDRFLKVENNVNVLYGGTGLGLSICKNIVELLGGSIWYESKIGEGTTFYFNLPLTAVDKASEIMRFEAQNNNYPDLKNRVLLIAEDEATNYRLLERYLSKTSAKLVWAKNGKEAVDFALNHPVDLILMDIKMPEMNGLQATIEIRKKLPALPIIAQTAYALQSEINGIKQVGIQHVLIKPINSSNLITILRNFFP